MDKPEPPPMHTIQKGAGGDISWADLRRTEEPKHHLKQALRRAAQDLAVGKQPQFLFVQAHRGTWTFHPQGLSREELVGMARHLLTIAGYKPPEPAKP